MEHARAIEDGTLDDAEVKRIAGTLAMSDFTRWPVLPIRLMSVARDPKLFEMWMTVTCVPPTDVLRVAHHLVLDGHIPISDMPKFHLHMQHFSITAVENDELCRGLIAAISKSDFTSLLNICRWEFLIPRRGNMYEVERLLRSHGLSVDAIHDELVSMNCSVVSLLLGRDNHINVPSCWHSGQTSYLHAMIVMAHRSCFPKLLVDEASRLVGTPSFKMVRREVENDVDVIASICVMEDIHRGVLCLADLSKRRSPLLEEAVVLFGMNFLGWRLGFTRSRRRTHVAIRDIDLFTNDETMLKTIPISILTLRAQSEIMTREHLQQIVLTLRERMVHDVFIHTLHSLCMVRGTVPLSPFNATLDTEGNVVFIHS